MFVFARHVYKIVSTYKQETYIPPLPENPSTHQRWYVITTGARNGINARSTLSSNPVNTFSLLLHPLRLLMENILPSLQTKKMLNKRKKRETSKKRENILVSCHQPSCGDIHHRTYFFPGGRRLQT